MGLFLDNWICLKIEIIIYIEMQFIKKIFVQNHSINKCHVKISHWLIEKRNTVKALNSYFSDLKTV